MSGKSSTNYSVINSECAPLSFDMNTKDLSTLHMSHFINIK